jgi:SsrA-binding protein
MNILAENKKAVFNHQILEKYEAGLVLLGQEVKSIRLGRANLAGSHIIVNQGSFWLVGCHIPPYQPKNTPADYLPERSRRLLLKKKEMIYLSGRLSQRGLTLLPLRIYTNDGKRMLKIEFALAKLLKKFDKREQIKAKEARREVKRFVR